MRGQRHAPASPYPRERPGTHCTGGWVGLRPGLDWCGKSRPPPGFDLRTVQPVGSRYTDYATRPTELKCNGTKWTLTTFVSRMLFFLQIATVSCFCCCVHIIQKWLCVCPPLMFRKCNASGVSVSPHSSRQGGRRFATCT